MSSSGHDKIALGAFGAPNAPWSVTAAPVHSPRGHGNARPAEQPSLGCRPSIDRRWTTASNSCSSFCDLALTHRSAPSRRNSADFRFFWITPRKRPFRHRVGLVVSGAWQHRPHVAPTPRELTMRCSFVPPYLLQHLAGDSFYDPAGAPSRSTLELDQRLRDQRGNAPGRLPSVLGARAGAAAAQRVIHSADNGEQLPGRVVRSDGDPVSGDLAVDEAFDSSAQVWDLFAEVFDRPSVDGKGSPLSVTVHYGQKYDN